jgi:filamentous hemagglutinin family protein
MKQIITIWSWSIGWGLVIFPAAGLHAQNVIFDGTLGVAGAAPTVRGSAGYRLRYNILPNRGVSAGNNLFYSFTRFSLASDEEAFVGFGSGINIRNILVRVTGNQVSNIEGRILTNQVTKPNLFLINPTGIYFGVNARIDNIGIDNTSGSFAATTVDAIQFPNGQFSAVNPLGKDSLLKIVGDPSGFIASQRQPGDITVATRNRFPSSKEVNGLAVSGGQNLLLLGGNVFFSNSSVRTVGIAGQGLPAQTDGIHFQVGSVLGAGSVGLQQQTQGWLLNLPETMAKGNVSLQNAEIYIGARTGGSLQINANTLTATASELAVAVTGGNNLLTARGGDVQLSATGSLRFERTIVSNEVVAGGNAQGGDIRLAASQMITRSSQIRADSFGNGNAGSLTVNATQLVDLSGEYLLNPANPDRLNSSGPGGLFSQINQGAVGNGGNLVITTPLLRVQDGSKVQTATFGTGQAGTIKIVASQVDVLKTRRPSNYPTSINAGVSLTLQPNLEALGLPTGNAGALAITADRVKVDGGSITVANFGIGKGGDLQITARDRIAVDNHGEISTTTRSGQGGNLVLAANSLILLRHGGQLNATAGTPNSRGNGGNIQLKAPFLIAVPIENSDIVANAFQGRGGNITITAQQLLGLQFRPQLTSQSDITASSDIGLNGLFTLNTPDLDPNRGLVQLPTAPTDPSNQIDQSCASSSPARSRFTATGRGGLPSQPDEAFGPSETLPRLATLPTAAERRPSALVAPTLPIVEAQAALRLPTGKIRFVVQTARPTLAASLAIACLDRPQPGR